jgi:hypothetical protein
MGDFGRNVFPKRDFWENGWENIPGSSAIKQ